jgi:hypothetical protein
VIPAPTCRSRRAVVPRARPAGPEEEARTATIPDPATGRAVAILPTVVDPHPVPAAAAIKAREAVAVAGAADPLTGAAAMIMDAMKVTGRARAVHSAAMVWAQVVQEIISGTSKVNLSL